MENVTAAQVKDALECVIASFQTVLYEDDEQFLENMKTKNLEGDDIRRYQHWEWTQGVGLYGFWRLFEATKKPEYLDILKRFYEKQMEVGLPGKNINTVTPLLAMSYFAEYTKNDEYLAICDEWTESIMHDFLRTEEGGLQITIDGLMVKKVVEYTVNRISDAASIISFFISSGFEKKIKEEAERLESFIDERDEFLGK